MKILVITKRQYTSKDILDDRYGRLREIPLALAERGHRVHGICFSYRNKSSGNVDDSSSVGESKVIWLSISPGILVMGGIYKYISTLKMKIEQLKPDFIWASSDCLHIIAGVTAGYYCNVPCIADLYDNYESFALSRLPFVIPLFRKAITKASAYTCVSIALAEYIQSTCNPTCPHAVIENAVDNSQFKPMDQRVCRQFFSLPLNAKIVGTAGALQEDRGISTLYRAYEQLALSDPELHLLLAGPVDNRKRLPKGPHIHYLGEIGYEHIPKFMVSLNVGVICNIDSNFGRYNFPQKAYEMIGCRVPIVSANVGSMRELLRDKPELLFEPENSDSLARTITKQLRVAHLVECPIPTWKTQAKKLEKLAENMLNGYH